MNPGTAVIVNLLGGVALLLWGVRMVRTGVMRTWGERLKFFIEHRLGSRWTAFLAGGLATIVVGSGTATSLIVTNIAATGALPLFLGLSVLLGADVGSAVLSSAVASGSSLALWTSPIFLFIGYILFNWSEEFKPHNMGRILIGLGLMLLSLRLVSQATMPLNAASLFHDVLSAVGQEPPLAFLVGALMAWAFHSTLASILLIASLLANGSMEFAGAFGFILGINCGGSLPAVTGALGLPVAARRLPVSNFICRSVFGIILLLLAHLVLPYFAALPLNAMQLTLAFHVAFNVAVALIFLPIAKILDPVLRQIMPDANVVEDTLARPRYLDASALNSPSIALANATIETARMSEVLDRMFKTALKAMANESIETLKLLKQQDDQLNTYQSAVQNYVSEISQENINAEQSRKALEITLYVSNLEHAGDIIHLNLADRIQAKVKEAAAFTIEEQASLDNLCLIIHDNIRLATAVLGSGDVEGAKRLIAQKDAFRLLENQVIDEHFKRGPVNKKAALRRSALFIDIIRDLHRINSHIVSAGYPIVDAAGLLRSSRLRQKTQGQE
jgi:phosphate:Na+ symporter